MKNKRNIGILAGVLAAGLCLAPWLGDAESSHLNQTTRAGVAGSFVQLGAGIVHYELAGPETGPVMVLVHGFSTPYYIWDQVVPSLNSAGFRTLRFDLYGRGFSDRPDIAYDLATYDTQLTELLDRLELRLPVRIVGISMGGLITANFALKHPERVGKIALIAPFGLPQDSGLAATLVRAPLIGEWMMASLGDRLLRSAQPRTVRHPSAHRAFLARFSQQQRYHGFKRALLRTLRTVVARDFSDLYQELGKHSPPTLLIWGESDAIVPFANSRRLRKAMPDLQFHALADTGHLPPVEQPTQTARLLVQFLR